MTDDSLAIDDQASAPPRDDAPPVRGWLRLLDVIVVAAGGLMAWIVLDAVAALFATLWWGAVVVVVRSDLARFIIPDTATAAIAALGLGQAVLPGIEGRQGLVAVGSAACSALAGGGIAFGLFWLLAAVYRRRAGREGLGFGDVKLAGACALWLDAGQQAVALEIACVSAIAVVLIGRRAARSRHAAVPFGAFLAPAAWLVFVAGPLVQGLWDRGG